MQHLPKRRADSTLAAATLAYIARGKPITICPPCRYTSATAIRQSRRITPSAAQRRNLALHYSALARG